MNTAELKAIVSLAEPFLMTQDFIPVLQHFWFHPDHVTAYNDIQAIKLQLKTDLHCAVPGKTLSKLLDTINQESIDITMDGSTLLVGSGKNKARLPTLPKEEFVFVLPDVKGIPITFDNDLRDGLNMCLTTVGYNPTQPERNGVSLCIETDCATFYATDGITISRFRIEGRFPISKLEQMWIIMPTFFCQQLITVMKALKLPATLHFTPDSVIAVLDEHKIFSRLINAKPPQFEAAIHKFIPGELSEFTLHPIPEDLPWAISRAILMLYPEKNIKTSMVTITPQGLLSILTESDKGRVYDEVLTPITPEKEIRLKINPEQIKRACEYCPLFSVHGSVFVFGEPNKRFYSLVSTQS